MLSYKSKIVLLAMAIVIRGVVATIDLNLQELQYVADHLEKSDCRKLVAALYDPDFYLENNIDIAERKLPEDISCLKLLLHWNSQPGEGKGKSHVLLVRRMKQLGHDKLAEWLSGTVFRQLGDDLNRTLFMDPFKELAQTNETESTVQETSIPTEVKDEDHDGWLLMDTVCRVLIMFFVFLIILIPAHFVWKYFRRKRNNREKEVQKRSVAQLGSARISDAERNGQHSGEMFELVHNPSSVFVDVEN
jgi:hypothetical protein